MAGHKRHGRQNFPLGPPPVLSSDMPFNPFLNNSLPLTGLYEIVKTILLLPLFLFRILLLLILFVLGYISTKIAIYGVPSDASRPFPVWRRSLLWGVRGCARGVLFACGYHWIRVKGKVAPRHIAPILICNHVTFVDPVFVFFAHLPMIVTAKENLGIPIAGDIMRAIQVITVDRSSPTSRKGAGEEIRRRAICNDWPLVALFPEATTTNGRALVSFKGGAFAPGLPVQLMVVRYPHVSCDPSWVVNGPAIPLLLFRLMTQLHNHMEVEYLGVLEPSRKEIEQPYLFADRCRMHMARALNVTVTEHTFGDVALAIEATKEKPQPSAGLTNVEFGRMERMFRLEIKEAKVILWKFLKMDVHQKGVLTYDTFLEATSLPDSPAASDLFSVFDTADRGRVTFREFLLTIAFITRHAQFQSYVDSLFHDLDVDGDGKLSKDEFTGGYLKLIPEFTEQQLATLFGLIDHNNDGSISRLQFADFNQSNPEHLAALLIGRSYLEEKEKVKIEAVDAKEE